MNFRVAVIAFVSGCLLACQWRHLHSPLALLLLFPVPLLLLRQHALIAVPAMMLAALLYALMHAALLLQQELPADLQGETIALSGVIHSVPERIGEGGLRFEFLPDWTHLNQSEINQVEHLPKRVRLGWYHQAPALRVGQRWYLHLRMQRPVGFFNSGGFDYELWLFRHRIRATGYVLASADNYQLEQTSAHPVERMREWLMTRIQMHLAGHPMLGLIEALSIGLRDNIDAQQWQRLRLTGTAHLVAISGLHVGLAALLGYLVGSALGLFVGVFFSRAPPAPRVGILMALLLAVFYAALSGFALPTQRALVMLVCLSLIRWFGWRIAAVDLLLVAALLVLLLDPLAVSGAGFWLSFGAVFVIIYSLTGRAGGRYRWLDFARVSVVTGIGLLPILALFFGQHPLWSPLVNLVAVPWASFICVPLVLMAVCCEFLLPTFAGTLWQWLASALAYLWQWLGWCATLPAAQLDLAKPGVVSLGCAIIAVLLLLSPLGLRWRWLAGLWLLPLLFPGTGRPAAGSFELILLDVGQGLSVVIRTHGHDLIYDTGARFSPSFDAGSAVLVPWLRAGGVGHIDRLIISHSDSDHAGGADSLRAAVLVRDILTSDITEQRGSRACYAGQRWRWDGVDFEILWPGQGHQLEGNNASCVLRVTAGANSVLLTGDIEWQSELALMRSGRQLQARVLVAGHHGSNSSSTALFIDQVDPSVVLMAAGYRNRYGFPAEPVVARFQARKITGYNSFACGEMRFLVSAEKLHEPVLLRPQQRHFWHADTGQCQW